MSVDAVSSAASNSGGLVNGGVIKSANSAGQLSMSDFFTLMAAELQNQDPMNPTDDSQYMSQMAQFGTLEQITNLATSYNFSMASGSVGKKVDYSYWDDSTGKTVSGSGTISSVDVSNLNDPSCMINGKKIMMSDISKIYSDSAANTGTSSAAAG